MAAGVVETTLRTLFRRCVQCPDETPSCPVCPEGSQCALSGQTCAQCASTSCGPVGLSGSAGRASTRKTNVGAIAGGVVGGIAVVVILTWLVWRFCIKARRQRYEEEETAEEKAEHEKTDRFTMTLNDRASMHTVGSTNSTVFTRASNIIQIAYIPGVTNRSPPQTPGLLVPPVPPLPHGSTFNPVNTPVMHQDQHFFMPDLRDSTYSGLSDSTFPRDSVAPSLARSSVATTIYRNNAVVNPVPVQTGIRGKAAVVSVKSSSQNSPNESRAPTPPMPAIDHEKYATKGLNVKGASDLDQRGRPPSPAFSVGSTFLNGTANMAKAVTARPVSVRRPSNHGQINRGDRSLADAIHAANSMRSKADSHSTLSRSPSGASKHSRALRHDPRSSNLDEISDDEEPGARARKSLIGHQRDSGHTVIDDTPISPYQSPFSDTHAMPPSPEALSRHGSRKSTVSLGHDRPSSDASARGLPSAVGRSHSGSLSAVIEETARKGGRHPTNVGTSSNNRDPSPFSDDNEVRTP
ncbi:MAG: hypothetical protein M1816_006373 [Peltula sp. TS41687]|nr:MAG: hypothetical protein M1816_006373 [Peltula sp. TS41687]